MNMMNTVNFLEMQGKLNELAKKREREEKLEEFGKLVALSLLTSVVITMLKNKEQS